MDLHFTLENERAKLVPLDLENYGLLIPVASQKKLIQYSPSAIETPEKLYDYVKAADVLRTKSAAIPFLVYDKLHSAHAGSTRYMNIDWKNKVIEIGSTWIGKEFQGTGLNQAMKKLMIDHAFQQMGFEKVEFRIDERNLRSRKAVEKLGASLEGVLRKNVYLLDGFKRNTCCYGLLPDEWKG
ncbi:GNAT family N-acetyltransferase [Allomuricauda sp. SCSIO 65647]|uniref:GNAT family N-acetyltransferase n=1 Tax=Allomuricauda sp. SCSIO 65647 TaxID=2908843 RepID=UPI001F389979|nr:GNAT family protein [Muricauda sp. SCSIO 65647]UJH67119.1 GNAT family N-acetyltransferase [Muricauda sp. SCSIO 65647]